MSKVARLEVISVGARRNWPGLADGGHDLPGTARLPSPPTCRLSGRGNNWVNKICAQRETLTIAGFSPDEGDGIYLDTRDSYLFSLQRFYHGLEGVPAAGGLVVLMHPIGPFLAHGLTVAASKLSCPGTTNLSASTSPIEL